MRLLVLFLIMNLQFAEHKFFHLKYSLCCPGRSHHSLLTPHPLWIVNAPADIPTTDLPNKCSVQRRAQSFQWQAFLFANASGSTVAPTHLPSQIMGTDKIKSADYTIDLYSNPANYVGNEHAVRKKLSKARTEKHYDNDGMTALSDIVRF